MSLPGYTWKSGWKYFETKLQTLQGKDLVLSIEKNVRGGISSLMSDRYAKSEYKWKTLDIDANNLYDCGMSEYLAYD